MAGLGPFEPAPRLAVAVSGGADSSALALLARDWAAARGGSVLGLVVDHGLRAESATEAALAATRLASRGIAARVLALAAPLAAGTALAERARAARYEALGRACAAAGIPHLLLGHHAADQAETVLMRRLSASGPDGLAGMAALVERPGLRLLRPLLGVPPAALRALLRADGLDWSEDPSNASPTALRSRLRALHGDAGGDGPGTRVLVEGAAAHGAARAAREAETAAFLGRHARLYPEGYAVLAPGVVPAAALAALIGGAAFAPSSAAVAALAASPRPATLGGVRLLAAGKMGPGWLLVREAAAMAAPVAARPGAIWDGRFRLAAGRGDSVRMGPLGDDAAALRDRSHLPAVVARTLPTLRGPQGLVAVPHLCYPSLSACAAWRVLFAPARGAAGAPFVTAAGYGNRPPNGAEK
jgi:tRNA(Ile)-lysidine synthase